MKLSKAGNSVLAELICDDQRIYKYRTLKELESLFYGNFDGNFSDGSRKDYCEFALNNIKNLEITLKEISDYRNFEGNSEKIQNNFLEKLNLIIEGDGLQILKKTKSNLELLKVENLNSKKIVETNLKDIKILSSEYIREHIEKAEQKIQNDDFSGAITNAKTLLEQVIRDLSKELNIEYKESNFKNSFDNIREKMNLSPKNYEHEGFKKILSGLIVSVDGIMEVRNKCSDGHSRKYNPSKHHAKLCTNASLVVCEFLVESYLYQKRGGNE